MKKIRTILIAIMLLLGVFLSVAPVVRADDYGLGAAAEQAGIKDKKIAGYNNVTEAIGGIIKIVLDFLGIIFFLLVLYAGFVWMTSMGNTEKVEQAKGIIEGAAIGLIVVIASYAIATFLFNSLDTGSANIGSVSTSTRQASSKDCVENNGTCKAACDLKQDVYKPEFSCPFSQGNPQVCCI